MPQLYPIIYNFIKNTTMFRLIILASIFLCSCGYKYKVEVFSAKSDMYEVLECNGIITTQRQLAYGLDDVKYTIQKMKEARKLKDSINR